ncbi:MAG TPA: TonB family protein [Opitutaceae bacterium]|nr:TonB family protein [Opitutaceae bacterium]
MTEDAELLRRYADDRSEAAFAELVQRHLALVYSVARRQAEPDRHLAEDVAQKVFADLARKARPLSRHPVLTGWLYRSAQFTAIDLVRSERRRRAREQEAQTMQEIMNSSDGDMEGEKLRPVLDQVIGELNDGDRDAVMLRFFEGRPFAEVGRKLQLSEDAARMRVQRALDKLRALLVRRGVTSTTAALAGILAGQGGMAAPTGLAAVVTGGALSGAGGTATLATFMSISKLQIGIAAVLVVATTTGIVVQRQLNARLANETETSDGQEEIARLQAENRRLAQVAQEVESYRSDVADLERLKQEAAALEERARAAEQQRAAAARAAASAAADAATIYDISQVDQVPVATASVKPVYPFELRRAGVTGQAVVGFVVDASGQVQDVRGVSATHPEFEAAAVDAIKKWKFNAGQKAGIPVGVRVQVPIVFN